MVLSTSRLRVAWAPHCQPTKTSLKAAYASLDACFKAFGYRPRKGVTGAQNCRRITGGTGYSLHAFAFDVLFTFWTLIRIGMALAVDVNWDKNPYGPRLVTDMPRPMIDAIYRIRTNSGAQVWRWGGYYAGNKDAMHFEIVCSPADLATGINPATLPGGSTPPPPPTPPEDDMPKPFLCRLSLKSPAVLYVSAARDVHWVRDPSALAGYQVQLRLDRPDDGDKGGDVCVLSTGSADPNIAGLAKMVLNLPFKGDFPPGHAEVWVGPHLPDNVATAKDVAAPAVDVPALAAAIVAKLPAGTNGGITKADVTAAIKESGLLGLLPGQ